MLILNQGRYWYLHIHHLLFYSHVQRSLPFSLHNYATRNLNRCKDEAQKAACQSMIEEVNLCYIVLAFCQLPAFCCKKDWHRGCCQFAIHNKWLITVFQLNSLQLLGQRLMWCFIHMFSFVYFVVLLRQFRMM